MTSLALCSASGAPGVTTTALALTWIWPRVANGRGVVLVDADPSGSGLLGGALRAQVPPDAGLLALAADSGPLTVDRFLAHTLALDAGGNRSVLPGISDPVQARALSTVWSAFDDLAVDLHLAGVDTVVDAGRLGHRSEPSELLADADVVAIALDPTVAASVAVAAALRPLTAMRAPRRAPVPFVVGEGRPYTAREIESALGVDVATVALDSRAATALGAGEPGEGRLDRSVLLRSVRALAETLLAALPAEAIA
ncbi:hypothetical protein Q6346_00095 [Isoptericola sp. b490]|uniref:hypothetical protein n=1 Tax=Actinotalea lenta TaxID=3064654 RepID=UPI002712C3DF|nr:hypothetical protein [Isoptericola sp. b490]MDO8119708.1 hypothetical protein [Isoptericola sp. b490]